MVKRQITSDFDLLENKYKIIKNLQKSTKGLLYLAICPDCKKHWIFDSEKEKLDYIYFKCSKCGHNAAVFNLLESAFVCNECHKSWDGFIYHELCPKCRG